ncbi:MAG: Ig-like domain-containing protein [bacterium]|jgi:hypothetical protein
MKYVALVMAVTIAAGISTGCGGDDGSGPLENAAPAVTLTDPADGATGISPNRPVRVSFSEPMDEASLDSIFIDGITVGAIEYDGDTHTATMWLAEMPDAETEYEVRVAAAVQDQSGKGMEGDYTFSYTTGPFSCGNLYDPFEENDEIATAKDVEINSRYWLVPSCGEYGRYDYYRFTLQDPAKATVKLGFVHSDSTHYRWGISFYREDGSDYAQVGYAPVTFPRELSYHFSFLPGTYYALIYGQDNGPFTGIYNFTIETSEPCQDDEYEDNDFPDEARPITAGLHEGLRGCHVDQDYYTIDMEAGKTLRVTMSEFSSVGGSRMLNITGPGANVGGINQTEPRVETVLAQAGTYMIRVRWWDDGVIYDLNVEVLD